MRAPESRAEPACAASGCSVSACASASGIARGCDQVDVLAGLGHPPRRAGDGDRLARGVLAQRLGELRRRPEARPRAAASPALPPLPACRARRGRSPRAWARGPSRSGSAHPRRRREAPRGWIRRARRTGAAPSSRPRPGIRVTSTKEAGNFAFSFVAEGISPVSSRVTIFPSSVFPIPGSSVARPSRARSATDTGLCRTTRAASR